MSTLNKLELTKMGDAGVQGPYISYIECISNWRGIIVPTGISNQFNFILQELVTTWLDEKSYLNVTHYEIALDHYARHIKKEDHLMI